MSNLDALQQRLGHSFAEPALLRQALTHRSWGADNNERLEFIGDAVLNLAVSRLLWGDADADEGSLSYWRARLVREQTLAELAAGLGLGALLRLGEGEQRSGGASRPSMLADALEALLGAVFLDGGFDAAAALVGRLYAPLLAGVDIRASAKDAKTLLQERLQGRRLQRPVYTVQSVSGPAHRQQFQVECAVAELALRSSGAGTNRRAAEQQAAAAMLDQIDRATTTEPA